MSFALICLFISLLLISGCGGHSGEIVSTAGGGEGSLIVRIIWPSSANSNTRFFHQQADRVNFWVQVNGQNTTDAPIAVVDKPEGGGVSTTQLSVPSGPVTIVGEAIQISRPAQILSRASFPTVLLPGDNPTPISLSFESLTDHIQAVKNPEKSSYAIGEHFQIVATSYGSNGEILFSTPEAFTYTTVDTAIVSVDGNGQVEVLNSGAASIVVSERGAGSGGKSIPILVNVGGSNGWSIQYLGTLGGSSRSLGVSANGNVVFGVSNTADGSSRAFRWTATTGMESLGAMGLASTPKAASADGSVIVGSFMLGTGRWHAFRWTATSGMQDLGVLPGDNGTVASGVSADGSVVVGESTDVSGNVTRIFRWTFSSGMQDLGLLGASEELRINGISGDAGVLVGWSGIPNSHGSAIRWTLSTGLQALGTIGGAMSGATGTNSDGSVVVGDSEDAAHVTRAFMWTAGTGIRDLGTLPGTDTSGAWAISGNGLVVVGSSWRGPSSGASSSPELAFVWADGTGLVGLRTLTGDDSSSAFGVSRDGNVVVGYSANTGQSVYRAVRWYR